MTDSAQKQSRRSLRSKIIGTMGILLLAIMGIGVAITYIYFSAELKDAYRERGLILARSLASASGPDFLYQKKDAIEARFQRLAREYEDIEYLLAVLKPVQSDREGYEGEVWAFYQQARAGSRSPATLIKNHDFKGKTVEIDGLLAFTVPVERQALFLDKDEANSELDGAPLSAKPSTGATLGTICLGLSTASLRSQTADALRTLFGVLFGLSILFVVIIFFYLTSQFTQRLSKIIAGASRISSGDLTETVTDNFQDEIGDLSNALSQISLNLNDIMSAISGVSDSMADAVRRITGSTEEVVQGAELQVTTVDETSSSMAEMLISLKGIAENVEILASSAEESSSSILEMAATNDEMADNIHSLAGSVEETTASIGQMTQTIKEVARNVEDLSATADETSASMREMDVTISQVGTNANLTAELSEEVRRDADRGSESVKLTMQGISRISESTQDAFHVMGSLSKKIQSIGQVLTVIDDVAEQTNLLALNAAIIAAQAGEHGKGFAVVADEIKELAERTAASTSEIVNLIQGVQSETKNVIDAMQRGLKNVEEGVQLSTEAEAALCKILDSSTKSTQMVREIARATVEQARGSKEVTGSIGRIAETVQQIATATGEQAKGSEQIMNSAERMRIITQHVHASSQEQARGSKQITRAIGNISEMVNHLNRAQREQARGAEQVMKTIERIKEIAERHSQAMGSMKKTVDFVAEQADTLRAKMSRLKL